MARAAQLTKANHMAGVDRIEQRAYMKRRIRILKTQDGRGNENNR